MGDAAALGGSKATLGRSGLSVTRLGLAASYGLSERDVERAFERGVDFFYWGAVPRPAFGRALRRLGGQHRDRMRVVVQSNARWPSGLATGVEWALRRLRFDHADVMLLGWWNLPPRDSILDAAAALRERGRVRAVMISCHHRPTFEALARDPRVDLVMVRYNAAHPGAERDTFPKLGPEPPEAGPAAGRETGDLRPGVVAYTATSWGELLRPEHVGPGERAPTSADCYRFALSHPAVGAVWCGPSGTAQLDAGLAALEAPPMDAEERAWMLRIGERARAAESLRGQGSDLADRFVNLASGFGFRGTAQLSGKE